VSKGEFVNGAGGKQCDIDVQSTGRSPRTGESSSINFGCDDAESSPLQRVSVSGSGKPSQTSQLLTFSTSSWSRFNASWRAVGRRSDRRSNGSTIHVTEVKCLNAVLGLPKACSPW